MILYFFFPFRLGDIENGRYLTMRIRYLQIHNIKMKIVFQSAFLFFIRRKKGKRIIFNLFHIFLMDDKKNGSFPSFHSFLLISVRQSAHKIFKSHDLSWP